MIPPGRLFTSELQIRTETELPVCPTTQTLNKYTSTRREGRTHSASLGGVGIVWSGQWGQGESEGAEGGLLR